MKSSPVPLFALLLCLSLTIQQTAFAAPPQQSALASPVPAQIRSAHTIFLTNAGADPKFPVDSTRVYNDIYAALVQWGHYQLAASAQQADLIFQLHDVDPITNVVGNGDSVYTVKSPAFQLTVIDPHTNTALWTLTSPVALAGKKTVFDHWVAISEENLISRLRVLSGEPLSAAQTADLTTLPRTHRTRNAVIIISAAVGLGVAGGLILHHEFDSSVSNQKATQAAFCTANNIPLSMCAGG